MGVPSGLFMPVLVAAGLTFPKVWLLCWQEDLWAALLATATRST